jgi:hypothetical protein
VKDTLGLIHDRSSVRPHELRNYRLHSLSPARANMTAKGRPT